MKKNKKAVTKKKTIPLTENQERGLGIRMATINKARQDYGTYLQAIMDSREVEGDWALDRIEDGKLILLKQPAQGEETSD